jgi:hypothetical protein
MGTFLSGHLSGHLLGHHLSIGTSRLAHGQLDGWTWGGHTHTHTSRAEVPNSGKIFSQTRVGRESLSLCVELIMIIPLMMRYEKIR